VLPIASSPRLLMKYVRKMRIVAVTEEHVGAMPLRRREVSVKLSVIVYQGICHSIRVFRREMSACGAREAKASVVSRALRWAKWATLVGAQGAATAGGDRASRNAGLEGRRDRDELTDALRRGRAGWPYLQVLSNV